MDMVRSDFKMEKYMKGSGKMDKHLEKVLLSFRTTQYTKEAGETTSRKGSGLRSGKRKRSMRVTG